MGQRSPTSCPPFFSQQALKYLIAFLALVYVFTWIFTSTLSRRTAPPMCVQPRIAPYEDRRILIVIPMPPFQWQLAKENLDSWSNQRFFPCDQDAVAPASMVDLLLLVSRDGHDIRNEALVSCGKLTSLYSITQHPNKNRLLWRWPTGGAASSASFFMTAN